MEHKVNKLLSELDRIKSKINKLGSIGEALSSERKRQISYRSKTSAEYSRLRSLYRITRGKLVRLLREGVRKEGSTSSDDTSLEMVNSCVIQTTLMAPSAASNNDGTKPIYEDQGMANIIKDSITNFFKNPGYNAEDKATTSSSSFSQTSSSCYNNDEDSGTLLDAITRIRQRIDKYVKLDTKEDFSAIMEAMHVITDLQSTSASDHDELLQSKLEEITAELDRIEKRLGY